MSVSYLLKRSGLVLTLFRLPCRALRRIGNHINSLLWRIHLRRLGKGSIIEMGFP